MTDDGFDRSNKQFLLLASLVEVQIRAIKGSRDCLSFNRISRWRACSQWSIFETIGKEEEQYQSHELQSIAVYLRIC